MKDHGPGKRPKGGTTWAQSKGKGPGSGSKGVGSTSSKSIKPGHSGPRHRTLRRVARGRQ